MIFADVPMRFSEAALIEGRLSCCGQTDEDDALGHGSILVRFQLPRCEFAAHSIKLTYRRYFPSLARIVAFKSVSEVDIVRSRSASATASSKARIS